MAAELKAEGLRWVSDHLWKRQAFRLPVSHGQQKLVHPFGLVNAYGQHQIILPQETPTEFTHRWPQRVCDAHGQPSTSVSIEG